MWLKAISLFVLCNFYFPAKADHIAGKTLNYDLVSSTETDFTINLSVVDFFNCESDSGPNVLTAPIAIYQYDPLTNQYDNAQVVFLPRISFDILANIDYECLAFPNEICTTASVYLSTITLPKINKDYFFINSACCWTESTVNIIEPESNGLLLTKSISQLEQQLSNSPLQFSIDHSFTICNNELSDFIIPINDADGDSGLTPYKLDT